MPDLLRYLGFKVHERSRRAPCILCGAHNPSTFSWTEDGRWHCFRCNGGGDKYAVIRAVLRCSFPEAVKVLCDLAGLPSATAVEWREPNPAERRKRCRLEAAAEKYAVLERLTRLDLAENLCRLERLGDLARERLRQLRAGAPERFTGEIEVAWSALALAYKCSPAILAAYCVVSFASEEGRQRFVLYPAQRDAMGETCLLRGGVVAECGQFVELAL